MTDHYVEIDYNGPDIALIQTSSDRLRVGDEAWGWAEGDGTRVPIQIAGIYVATSGNEYYTYDVYWSRMEDDPRPSSHSDDSGIASGNTRG